MRRIALAFLWLPLLAFNARAQDASRNDKPAPSRVTRAEAAACSTPYDSSACLKRQAALQTELSALYDQEERAVLSSLKDYAPEFKDEAIRSLRETYRALANYKDAECLSEPLVQGMSLRDSGVIADECKVTWRSRQVREMKKRLERQRP